MKPTPPSFWDYRYTVKEFTGDPKDKLIEIGDTVLCTENSTFGVYTVRGESAWLVSLNSPGMGAWIPINKCKLLVKHE